MSFVFNGIFLGRIQSNVDVESNMVIPAKNPSISQQTIAKAMLKPTTNLQFKQNLYYNRMGQIRLLNINDVAKVLYFG